MEGSAISIVRVTAIASLIFHVKYFVMFCHFEWRIERKLRRITPKSIIFVVAITGRTIGHKIKIKKQAKTWKLWTTEKKSKKWRKKGKVFRKYRCTKSLSLSLSFRAFFLVFRCAYTILLFLQNIAINQWKMQQNCACAPARMCVCVQCGLGVCVSAG